MDTPDHRPQLSGPLTIWPLGSAAPARIWLRTAPSIGWSGLLPTVWALLLTVLIAGPWLAGGYLFGTDWPGPRRIDFPTDLSNLSLTLTVLAVAARVLTAELTTKLLVFGVLFAATTTAYRALPRGGFIARAVASVVFVMNPFVYGRLEYGQFLVLAGYAVLPWVLGRLGRLLSEPRLRNGFMVGVALALTAALDLHMFL